MFLGDVEEELRTSASVLQHDRVKVSGGPGHVSSECRKCFLTALADEAADRHAALTAVCVTTTRRAA